MKKLLVILLVSGFAIINCMDPKNNLIDLTVVNNYRRHLNSDLKNKTIRFYKYRSNCFVTEEMTEEDARLMSGVDILPKETLQISCNLDTPFRVMFQKSDFTGILFCNGKDLQLKQHFFTQTSIPVLVGSISETRKPVVLEVVTTHDKIESVNFFDKEFYMTKSLLHRYEESDRLFFLAYRELELGKK